MKHITTVALLAGLLSPAWAASPMADAVKPAASAPKDIARPADPASAAVPSAAVGAANKAQQPGKLRPESAVVPQVNMPFGSAATPKADPAPGRGKAAVDQRAARCAAVINKNERMMCEKAI